MKFFKFILPILIIALNAQTVLAADRMGQARLFLGSTQVSPSELNTEMTAQGIKNVNLNNQFGVEITFPIKNYFNAGLRYSRRIISQDEETNGSNTDYLLSINQDVMAGVIRVPLMKNEYTVLDVVVGVGGSNTDYSIKTATQDGSLTKKSTPFATMYSTAGVSFGVGKGKYFFVIEAGYDSQKVDGFERSGNINNNVNSIDLSGAYLTIGFMFDGIPVSMGK